ncbi:hypothetical protein EBU71_15025 [bacterium]|nr:hypothetical protein [Candidatus Elulimicrobium humile]
MPALAGVIGHVHAPNTHTALASFTGWFDQSCCVQCVAAGAHGAAIQPSFVSLGLVAMPCETDCVPWVGLVGMAEQVHPHAPALQPRHRPGVRHGHVVFEHPVQNVTAHVIAPCRRQAHRAWSPLLVSQARGAVQTSTRHSVRAWYQSRVALAVRQAGGQSWLLHGMQWKLRYLAAVQPATN